MQRLTLNHRIDALGTRMGRSGWSLNESSYITLDGQRLWVVCGRQRGLSFSVRGDTREQAWQAAECLVQRMVPSPGDEPAIVPFPLLHADFSRVA